MGESVRTRLLDLLVERSYQRSDTPSFRLTSGKLSTYYVDCKATTMYADALPLVGEVVAERLPLNVEAVGGLTMGADPIALAAAFHCATQGRRVSAFSVRKEKKTHGMRKWIEGCAAAGARVAVVDDVCTTGGSTVAAIERCREEGLAIVAVVVLVDRQEQGGLEAIQRAAGRDLRVMPIFTRADLHQRWAEREKRRALQ